MELIDTHIYASNSKFSRRDAFGKNSEFKILLLNTLIQSQTRIKLLLRFFLNPESRAYLRGLAQEFGDSTNSVRVELNRFEEAGLIEGKKEGNKKMYSVNTKYPLFDQLQQIAFKHFGIDRIVDSVAARVGEVDAVWLTGDLARGLDTPVIDITLVGQDIDTMYLTKLIEKAEELVQRKIRYLVYQSGDAIEMVEPRVLIYGEHQT